MISPGPCADLDSFIIVRGFLDWFYRCFVIMFFRVLDLSVILSRNTSLNFILLLRIFIVYAYDVMLGGLLIPFLVRDACYRQSHDSSHDQSRYNIYLYWLVN